MWLDRLARVYGNIGGLDMYDNLIPVSWGTVAAYGPIMTSTTSLDRCYEMWIVNGTYTSAVSSPGYETQGAEITVSMAWETPADFDLRPPGSTVPELSAAELTLPAVLILVCVSMRMESSEPRRHRRFISSGPSRSSLTRETEAQEKSVKTKEARCIGARQS